MARRNSGKGRIKARGDKPRALPSRDNGKVPGPSRNPFTNLLLTDLMIRAGSYVVRDAVERGMLRGRYGRETAKQIVKNKSLPQKAVAVGLATLATRNLPGALLVGGGALVKTLLDRRKGRRKAQRQGDRKLIDQAQSDD